MSFNTTLGFYIAQLPFIDGLGFCFFVFGHPLCFTMCLCNYGFIHFSFFSSFTASKARRPYQFSGKITVKAKEKSYSKLEIPYQAEVLEG